MRYEYTNRKSRQAIRGVRRPTSLRSLVNDFAHFAFKPSFTDHLNHGFHLPAI
jgi:hypothetical protein